MDRRQGLYAAVSAVSVSLLLSAELHAPWSVPNIYSDVTSSFWGRAWVVSGSLPYISSWFEYPVLSGLLLYLVRLFGSTLDTFYVSFSAFSIAAGAVLAWACWGTAKKLGRELNPMFFILPSFLVYGIYNFDLFHALFVVLGLFAYLSGKKTSSAVLLGLAVDFKLTSVVLLPIFLIDLKTTHDRLRYLGAFVAVVVLFNVPFALLSFSNFLAGYQYVGGYGLEDAWYVWIFQSPSTWQIAKVFGLVVGGLLLLRVYTLKIRIEAKVALAIAAYLLGTYIYAPQFNLLLLPLLAVLDLKHPAVFPFDAFNALIILTWFLPNATSVLPPSWPQIFALLRDVCLVWLSLAIASREGASITGWLRRMRGGAEQTRLDATLGPASSP